MENGPESLNPSGHVTKLIKESPNISLNLRNRKSGLELRLTALVGVSLQLGVLVFSGLITYVPSWELAKEGRRVERYAYPFTASGTVILVVGMIICSCVVEQRTVEDVWKFTSTEGHLLWLQQGGEVGNQQFNSFAIFAKRSHDSIRTSRLFELSKHISEKDRPDRLAINISRLSRWWRSLKKSNIKPATSAVKPATSASMVVFKVLATVGSSISIIGFVVQFIGLRGMHWSATIAQLVATVIMTVLRVWVRRDLALRPKDQKTPQNHELDWVATRIAKDAKDLWPDVKRKDEEKSFEEHDEFWHERCWKWEVVSGMSAETYNLSLSTNSSDADSVVRVRKRLGSLSNWSGPVSQLAISIAAVIETIMDTLFVSRDESYQEAESMYWSINGNINGKHQPIYFKLKRAGRNGSWKADATEIEAVLSLWLYFIQSKEHGSRGSKDSNATNENMQSATEKDWLRHGDTALRQDSIRFLGRCLPSSCRDLTWYMGSRPSVVSVVEKKTRCPAKDKSNVDNPANSNPEMDQESESYWTEDDEAFIISVGNHRVFGFRDTHNVATTDVAITSVMRTWRRIDELWIKERETDPNSSERLVAISDISLELLVAQDLFSAFMWAIATEMDPIRGETTVHPTEIETTTSGRPSWQNFKVDNSSLSRVVHAFRKAKLGSLEEAYLCIIPPLSARQKLPVALPVVKYAQDIAQRHELVGHWKEAGDVYLWLFQVGKTFHRSDPISLKATAVLAEFYAVVRMERVGKEPQSSNEVIHQLEALEMRVAEELLTAHDWNIQTLLYLYQTQNRYQMVEFLNDLRFIKSKPKINAGNRFEINEEKQTEINDGKQSEISYDYQNKINDDDQSDINNSTYSDIRNGYQSDISDGNQYKDSDFNQSEISGSDLQREINYINYERAGLTSLHQAAIRKDRERDPLLGYSGQQLEKGANPNAKDLLDWTPLHYSVIMSNEDNENIIEDLQQPDPKAKTMMGLTALHLAAQRGINSVGWRLLQEGAELEARGRDGKTPLHCGVQGGHQKMVQWLLEAGADIEAQDLSRRTPLHWAALTGSSEIVHLLKESGAKTKSRDDNGMMPLHFAAISGDENSVKALIERGIVDSKDRLGHTPLMHGATAGYESIVRLLLGEEVDIEAKNRAGWTALQLAAKAGRNEVVRLLLANGADIEAKGDGQSALQWAAWAGNETMVRLLLEQGSNTEAKDDAGQTSLHLAARAGKGAVVRLLLEKGANIDAKDGDGQTPLHLAARAGKDAVVRLLLEWEVDIEEKDGDGQTPLHLAARAGKDAVVRLLLENGADIDAKNDVDETALQLAARIGQKVVFRLLFEKGVEIKAQDINNSRTALHRADSWPRGRDTAARLEKGSEIEVRNDVDKATAQWAASLWQEVVLSDKEAMIEAQGISSDRTAPHRAASWPRSRDMTAELEKGPGMEAPDNYDRTARQLVASVGEVQL